MPLPPGVKEHLQHCLVRTRLFQLAAGFRQRTWALIELEVAGLDSPFPAAECTKTNSDMTAGNRELLYY